jgi:Secretion system C-terminal sorting domain
MMHKCKIAALLPVFILAAFAGAAQTYELRAVNKGGAVLGVEIRIVSGTPPGTADHIMDIVLGVKWRTDAGIDLSNNISSPYNLKKAGLRTIKNNYYFQAFYIDPAGAAFPAAWAVNNWVELMSVSDAFSGSGTRTFEICEPGFDASTDPNIGVNAVDYTPAIAGSASDTAVTTAGIERFVAITEKNSVSLSWNTNPPASYTGDFEVQRSTGNTGSFHSIGRVKINPGIINTGSFLFTDKAVSPGNIYFYRLKQAVNSNRAVFSAVKPVLEIPVETEDFKILPNPARTLLEISLPGRYTNGKIKLCIIDAAGAVAISKQLQYTAGKNISINIAALATGTYFIIVDRGGSLLCKKQFEKI